MNLSNLREVAERALVDPDAYWDPGEPLTKEYDAFRRVATPARVKALLDVLEEVERALGPFAETGADADYEGMDGETICDVGHSLDEMRAASSALLRFRSLNDD